MTRALWKESHFEAFTRRLLFVCFSTGLASFRLVNVNHPCPGTTLHAERKWLAELHGDF